MATPVTPRHKRLAITDSNGHRASSTPPNNHKSHLAVPTPSSRHSSPGLNHYQARHYADDLIPRRLTASPIARNKSYPVRRRLTQYHSIDHAVHLLQTSRNIIVLSGAGISTSLDIPDFRSDGGFYSRLSSKIGITTPEEFFSLDFFAHNSEQFWDNVHPLLPSHVRTTTGTYQSLTNSRSSPRFSSTHALLALLASESRLLTNYTQNIDSLEFAAGIPSDRVIQCHGSWSTATCLTCSKTIPAKKYLPIVYSGNYPRCKCAGTSLSTSSKPQPSPKKKKRKRPIYEGDSDHSSDDGTAIPRGLYKPDITFFGEEIPGSVQERVEQDKPKADLLVIMGTSLKVRPVKGMLMEFAGVPQIWINRERYSGVSCDMPGVNVDIELLGECDLVVEELCRRAGMGLDRFLWKDAGEDRDLAVRVKAEGTGETAKTGNETRQNDGNSAAKNVKLVIEETVRKKLDAQESMKPVQDVRVISDLDAEWRWRISKRQGTASSFAGSQG